MQKYIVCPVCHSWVFLDPSPGFVTGKLFGRAKAHVVEVKNSLGKVLGMCRCFGSGIEYPMSKGVSKNETPQA